MSGANGHFAFEEQTYITSTGITNYKIKGFLDIGCEGKEIKHSKDGKGF
jgi:hypothetical protein